VLFKFIQKKGGADMQIYEQFLTIYRTKENNGINNRKKSRCTTHNLSELKDVYTNIQWNNRFAPIYLSDPSVQSIAYAVHIKESANSLKQTIGALGDTDDEIFSSKSAYCDNSHLASVEYVPEDATDSTPADFELKVESFATPQINMGSFLASDEEVSMNSGNYSFDMITNKFHYELQFSVNEGDTNKQLQQKLARLINASDIGVSADVAEAGDKSALKITSNSIGRPFQGQRRFNINDENTSYLPGIVDYLGLNSSIKEATNATYTVNGSKASSYSNSFKVHGAYHVTLNPQSRDIDAHIGLTPDTETLTNNIQAFVDGYNDFVSDISDDGSNFEILSKDMKKFLKNHEKSLSQYGITINDDSTLTYKKCEDATDAAAIKSFGFNMLRKLNAIAIDPMEYTNRRVCSYSNMKAAYPNPYVTSMYSGLLINIYT
jgi:flagellar hook-associated protein 2